MTDLEIDEALAKAIGWGKEQIDLDRNAIRLCVSVATLRMGAIYVRFSHKDPAVIWPIAERYGVFPSDCVTGDFVKHQRQGYPDIESWEVFYTDYKLSTLTKAKYEYVRADTAAKAVALAVIGMNK